jgi:hypothetical protein
MWRGLIFVDVVDVPVAPPVITTTMPLTLNNSAGVGMDILNE